MEKRRVEQDFLAVQRERGQEKREPRLMVMKSADHDDTSLGHSGNFRSLVWKLRYWGDELRSFYSVP